MVIGGLRVLWLSVFKINGSPLVIETFSTALKWHKISCNDMTRDVRTNLCNTTLTFSLIYFALSDA